VGVPSGGVVCGVLGFIGQSAECWGACAREGIEASVGEGDWITGG
jgi:hypothetical protein